MKTKKYLHVCIVFGIIFLFFGTSIVPSIGKNIVTIESNEIKPLPRWREGGTPEVPLDTLIPFSVGATKTAPTNSYIVSPPEYSPTHGVLFTLINGHWPAVVRDCIVALTAPGYDEIAYVVIPPGTQSWANSYLIQGGANMSKVQFIIEPMNSIWMRDYGPHFIWQDDTQCIVDSHYYPGRPNDNFIPTRIGDDHFFIPTYAMGLYYSGGNFLVDCNRNAYITSLIYVDNPAWQGFDYTFIANLYQEYQGIDTLHVFPALPGSVDGTGHIDMWMSIVNSNTVVISQFIAGSNPTAITITNNAATYMADLGFTVYRTPAWNVGTTHYTYTNAFQANNRFFVPTYASSYDAQALAVWQAAVGPNIDLVPIPCQSIIGAAGAIHCIVKQVPRYTAEQPAVNILYPDGGELLVSGTTKDIRWAAIDTYNEHVSNVELSYSLDDGSTWEPIGTTTTIGSYPWTVPDATSSQARIKAVATGAQGQALDISSFAFEIDSATQTLYDFSTGAGVDKFGYGHQTSNWNSFVNGIRQPVTNPLSAPAYNQIAHSDDIRYISSASSFSTHVFEFTIEEAPSTIKDIEVLWEGYASDCAQVELYIWDYVEGNWGNGRGGFGQNYYVDNWAGNRDGYLTANIRSDFHRYLSPEGQLTLLVFVERTNKISYHDYVYILVSAEDHYRILDEFPFHVSTVDTGAAVMKQMLDFLRWNSTAHPEGPPSVYSEQELFDAYRDFEFPGLYYADDSVIDEYQLALGLVNEIRTTFPVPPEYPFGGTGYYGYFFSAAARETALDALKWACTWIDYPVDFHNDIRYNPVPQPGHTNHVPVAVPTGGNYDNWMVIRGIHTSANAWPYGSEFDIYGFWINDPSVGGIGNNWYMTAQYFMDNYFDAMTVGLNQGQYVVVVDPPEVGLSIEEMEAVVARTNIGLAKQVSASPQEMRLIRSTSRFGPSGFANAKIAEIGLKGYESVFPGEFATALEIVNLGPSGWQVILDKDAVVGLDATATFAYIIC